MENRQIKKREKNVPNHIKEFLRNVEYIKLIFQFLTIADLLYCAYITPQTKDFVKEINLNENTQKNKPKSNDIKQSENYVILSSDDDDEDEEIPEKEKENVQETIISLLSSDDDEEEISEKEKEKENVQETIISLLSSDDDDDEIEENDNNEDLNLSIISPIINRKRILNQPHKVINISSSSESDDDDDNDNNEEEVIIENRLQVQKNIIKKEINLLKLNVKIFQNNSMEITSFQGC